MFNENSRSHAYALRALLAAVMIVLAAVARIAPHPWNFTPIGAMALFSGAILRDRRIALLFPLTALFAGDLMPVIYVSFLLNVLIGRWMAANRSVARVGGSVFLGALQFFLVTNFAMWRAYDTFPHTLAGLAICYLTGLPLFGDTLAGDAFYAALFFGTFALAERQWPALREPAVAHTAS
jgi:hypothetical protein